MKYEIIMNEDNQVKGLERAILLTLEKGLKLKAQGEALVELVKTLAENIIFGKGAYVESGEKSVRKLVWVKKGGKQYTITCTRTVRAGSVNWSATAELFAQKLHDNGIEIPAPIYSNPTSSTTYGFDGHEHKKAYEKKLFGNDLNAIAEKLGITAEE